MASTENGLFRPKISLELISMSPMAFWPLIFMDIRSGKICLKSSGMAIKSGTRIGRPSSKIDFPLLDTAELNKRKHLGPDQYFHDPRPRAKRFITAIKSPPEVFVSKVADSGF